VFANKHTLFPQVSDAFSQSMECLCVLCVGKTGCCNLHVQPGNLAGLKHKTLAEGNYAGMAIH